MPVIKIRPLSVNRAWQGRRYKTQEYKDYEQYVLLSLPKLEIPKGKLRVTYLFALSSKNADIDNPGKLITDILQKKYGFNDRLIYEMNMGKVDVKKGDESITFSIEKYE